MLNLKIESNVPKHIASDVASAIVNSVFEADEVRRLDAIQIMLTADFAPGSKEPERRTSYAAVVAGRQLHVWKMIDGKNVGTPLATIERNLTPAELAKNYNATIDSALRTLRRAYETGRAAVKKVVEESKADQAMYRPGAFARQVSWGNAVAEDTIAARAGALLDAIDRCTVTVAEALAFEIAEVERDLLRNRNRPTSTNPFSNAVAVETNEALTRWLEDIKRDARWIANARADMEVL